MVESEDLCIGPKGNARSTSLNGVFGMGAVGVGGLVGSIEEIVGLVKRAGCVGGLTRLGGGWMSGRVEVNNGGWVVGKDKEGNVAVVVVALPKMCFEESCLGLEKWAKMERLLQRRWAAERAVQTSLLSLVVRLGETDWRWAEAEAGWVVQKREVVVVGARKSAKGPKSSSGLCCRGCRRAKEGGGWWSGFYERDQSCLSKTWSRRWLSK